MKRLSTVVIVSGLVLLCHIKATGQAPLTYVNTFIGTAPANTESSRKHGTGTEEKGQTYPGVGRPFGMTQWTPETRTTEIKCVSPYYYNDKYITGFRGSHWMSGSCTQDYGSATIMPFTTSKPDTLKSGPQSKYNHKSESATPGYYRVDLDSYSVTTELTGTTRAGFIRLTINSKSKCYILIRMNSDEKQGRVWYNKETKEIQGYNPVHRIYQGSGKPAGFSGYFVIRTDKPVVVTDYLRNEQQIVLSAGDEKSLLLKIGTSFTSF
ncbi:MAG: glycoside hydrolase family 92 protein, partial [Bacteroidales bacterium]